jgi:hypothetical protein
MGVVVEEAAHAAAAASCPGWVDQCRFLGYDEDFKLYLQFNGMEYFL